MVRLLGSVCAARGCEVSCCGGLTLVFRFTTEGAEGTENGRGLLDAGESWLVGPGPSLEDSLGSGVVSVEIGLGGCG